MKKDSDSEESEEESGKVRLGFCLTKDGARLLRQLKKRMGLNQLGVVETLIRDRAKSEDLL